MANKGTQRGLGATDSGLKPGRYALGSPQSRAAARAMLDAREAAREKGILVRLVKLGIPVAPRKCTCKPPAAGTFAVCRCFC
jgi:hypothetical protein